MVLCPDQYVVRISWADILTIKTKSQPAGWLVENFGGPCAIRTSDQPIKSAYRTPHQSLAFSQLAGCCVKHFLDPPGGDDVSPTSPLRRMVSAASARAV